MNAQRRTGHDDYFIRLFKGFGLRALCVQVCFLFGAALTITLIVRWLLTSRIDPVTLQKFSEQLKDYVIFQDLLSIYLILCGAFCLGIFSFNHPTQLFVIWVFYFSLIGIAYFVNLKYFSLYGEHFAWFHLKEGTLGPEIWSSLWAEIDYILTWQIIALILGCLLWFFIGLQINCKVAPYTYKYNKKFFLSKCNVLRLSLFFLSLLSFLLTAKSDIFTMSNLLEKSRDPSATMQFLQLRQQVSNFLLKLSFMQRQKSVYTSSLFSTELPGPETNTTSTLPFRFGFDSTSKKINHSSDTSKPIPFARGEKYNIVIYIFESTSYAYLQKKVNGKEVTPNWNFLRHNAISFMKHYTYKPLSISSLLSILTSARGMPADIWAAREYPQIPLQSLPEILKKERGYINGFIHTGNLHYAGQKEFLKHRNFDLIQDMNNIKNLHTSTHYNKTINWGMDDRILIQAARSFVQETAGKPYFLVLSPMSPHHPYEIPEEKFRISQTNTSFSRYLNSLHYADAVMYQVVRSLETLPGGENTLFFILADHGEAFGQHRNNYNHPFYLYEENIHVPFIIYNSKLFTKSIQYQAISRHIDILPTILDMLSLPKKEQHHEGISLLKRAPHRIASFYTSWRNHLTGLRDGNWKYIYNLRYGTQELYNLATDPEERNNLEKKELETAKRYRKYLVNLHAYQHRYYEAVLKRPVNWEAKLDKTFF